ncbi:flagellar hook-associated protein FlgK [candidate division KSB1 bacterium]|nr:MAG: flagellar hook-associated protein FlgK [candidate division KSB1 bacterium]
MAIGLNTAFNVGKKGLRAQLFALNVTGNNIANVNTEGYSRRKVNLQTSPPLITTEGIFGTGVDIQGVRRIRDNLVDRQIRTSLKELGRQEIKERVLKQIETIYNEPAEKGIRGLLSQFFDNFQELANDPENVSTRYNVREQARVLANAFNRIDDQLTILSRDIEFELERKVADVNDYAKRIADLNEKILAAESVGGSANDFRDERDRLLDKLAKDIDIVFSESSTGMVNVVAGGRSLVFGGDYTEFKLMTMEVEGELHSYIVGANDNVEFSISNGEIKGLLDARNDIIPRYRQYIDNLAYSLITEVNNIHIIGAGLKGDLPEVPYSNNFFKGTDAGDIALDDAIEENVNNIAAAYRETTTDEQGRVVVTANPGDNRIALEIAELKRRLVLQNGIQSIPDYLNSIIGNLGVETQQAMGTGLNQKRLIEQFQNIRDSTSGVSLDEEFVDLIRYQRGYQASARFVKAIDEVFQTLVNLV